MNEIFERITFYVVGGIGGVAFGLILLAFDLAYIESETAESVLLVSAMAGIAVGASILEYRRNQTYKTNQKIWDEAVALIAHEMRTSLNSTSWAIQLILENYKDTIREEDKKMLDGVVSSIHTTVMHSVNLLDVSLLDIGEISLSLQRVTLDGVGKVIEESLAKFSIGAERLDIQLTKDIRLDPETQMEVDLTRLRIILENLLDNAIRYTAGATKKEIAVSVWNDTTSLHITVKDSGIGIPDADKHKIFSEFFRASNARKKLSSGSGIGLHMSEQYIHAHHGTVHFDSKENEGTTFFVDIPLRTIADVNEFLEKI